MPSDDASSDYSDWSKNENSDSEYEGYLENDNETLQNGPESELPQLSNSDECASTSRNSKTTVGSEINRMFVLIFLCRMLINCVSVL